MATDLRVLAPFSLERVGLRDGHEVYKVGLVFAGVPTDVGPWLGYVPKRRVTKVVIPPARLTKVEFKGLVLSRDVKMTTILALDKDGGISKVQCNVVATVEPADLADKLRDIAAAIDSAAGDLMIYEEVDGQMSMFDGPSLFEVPGGTNEELLALRRGEKHLYYDIPISAHEFKVGEDVLLPNQEEPEQPKIRGVVLEVIEITDEPDMRRVEIGCADKDKIEAEPEPEGEGGEPPAAEEAPAKAPSKRGGKVAKGKATSTPVRRRKAASSESF